MFKNKYPNKSIKRFLSVFFIILVLALIDFLFSFFIPRDNEYYNTYKSNHSFYHHTLLPNQDCITKWFDRKYRIVTNSLGFVDCSQKQVEKASKVKRILLMGDSFTEGVGNPYKNTFYGIIKNQIDEKKCELYNAGVSAYSPKLYYLKTKYLIEQVKFRFNSLDVFIDISDIRNEIDYYKFKPTLPKTEYSFVLKLKHFIRRNSFLYYSIATLKDRRTKEIPSTEEDNQKIHTELYTWKNIEQYHKELDAWVDDSTVFKNWGKKGLELAGDYMQKLFELCKSNNIEMNICIYPWPRQIRKQVLDNIHVNYWNEFALKNHIKCLNLFPYFINNENPEEVISKYYIKNDSHWNDEGHKFVASIIFDGLNFKDYANQQK